MHKLLSVFVLLLLISCQSMGSDSSGAQKSNQEIAKSLKNSFQNLDTATLAGGCFWCVEAAFEQIQGVVEAVSGYSGGKASTADYRLVSSGRTNHAEAVQVFYNPEVITYETILDIFFVAHDPTQINSQGPDVGTQYRSEIFYHNETQKEVAIAKMEALAPSFSKPIATKLSKLDAFYDAEDYHQDFEEKNPMNGYILGVSKPKIDKVARKFKALLKE